MKSQNEMSVDSLYQLVNYLIMTYHAIYFRLISVLINDWVKHLHMLTVTDRTVGFYLYKLERLVTVVLLQRQILKHSGCKMIFSV